MAFPVQLWLPTVVSAVPVFVISAANHTLVPPDTLGWRWAR